MILKQVKLSQYIRNYFIFSKRYQHHINAYMLEVDICKGQGECYTVNNCDNYRIMFYIVKTHLFFILIKELEFGIKMARNI